MPQHTITCLNGNFVPASTAMLPVADRGFRFGDGVFETLRLVAGVPYQWQVHMSRLAAGLIALRIAPPAVDWQQVIRQLIARNHASEGYVRISVSRGVGSRGYLPDADIQANWVAEYMPLSAPTGAPCQLWHTNITRPALSALPVNHKLAQGVGSTLALLEARDNACDEALMLSADGHLSEASSGNIFWLTGNQLFTPALATGCLAGSTRTALMRLADVREVTADMDALLASDAAFISNVRVGIWPIAALLPHGNFFNTTHPTIAALSQALKADQTAYATAHTKDWA